MDKTARLLLAVSVLLLLLVLAAAPATAGAEGSVLAWQDAPAPAVPVEEPPPAEDTPAWTFRYLIPTVLVIGGAAVVITVIQYFARVVRTRYRVVK